MRIHPSSTCKGHPAHQRAAILIIVLWVAFGLVSIALYFAHSMSLELRASDNRVSGMAAEQAIEGATRYVSYVLTSLGSNGMVPDWTAYRRQAVPIGDSRFWFIGRDHESQTPPIEPFFALVDEGSKLNLNTVGTNALLMLPRMTDELAENIIQWRSTNVTDSAMNYAMLHPAYQCKSTNFETVDELRLVIGAEMDILVGEDLNRNGVLDPDETDEDRNGLADPGILEYFTVYSSEPNSTRTNVNTQSQVQSLLQEALSTSRANQVMQRIGSTTTFRSLLQFYRTSGMTLDEFALVGTNLTVSSAATIQGRVNVNTASAVVLSCLPGMTADLAQQMISYRQLNPDKLTSLAWVVEALGSNNSTALDALAAGDYITTQSFQFSADIAALGPFGRGFQRVRFVFDMSDGTPRIIYRQSLSHLGWALGKEARKTWFLAKENND